MQELGLRVQNCGDTRSEDPGRDFANLRQQGDRPHFLDIRQAREPAFRNEPDQTSCDMFSLDAEAKGPCSEEREGNSCAGHGSFPVSARHVGQEAAVRGETQEVNGEPIMTS
jgi:hypothetical protein